LGVVTFVDDMQDFIHETIQANERAHFCGAVFGGQ